MDGVSLAASIVSLIDLSKILYNYTHAVIKASDERKKLLDVLDNLEQVLESLRDREEEARQNPNVAWYQGLIALSRSAKQASSGNGKFIPDGTGKGEGVLKRLKAAIEKMIAKLEIPKVERIRQRIMWPHQKVKFEEMLTEIERWQNQIDSILDQDHFRLSLDINARVQIIETDTRDINARTQIIEYDTKTIVNDTKELKNRLLALEERGKRKDREKERKAIISWLSPLEFRKRQAEIFSAKCTLTGNRLLRSTEFNAWMSGRPWDLFCQGIAGAGKTVLSSIVIEYLRNHFEKLNVPVLCLYLNYKESMIQTLENLIGSLLKQLIQYQGDKFQSADVKALFERGYDEAPPMLDELCQALQSEIVAFSRVMIVVDALDEVGPDLRAQLLSELRSLPAGKTSLMVTSRPFDTEFGSGRRVQCRVCKTQPLKIYFTCGICDGGEYDLCQDCKDKFGHCKVISHVLREPYQEVRMNIDPTETEIKYYVEWALEKEIQMGNLTQNDQRLAFVNDSTTNLGDRCREDPTLKDRIESIIVKRADGMFMLAKLYMESLKVKLSVTEVDEALKNLPFGYTETYDRAMDRIDAPSLANPSDHSSYLARRILTLVAFTFRPLSLLELQEALAVDLHMGEFRPVIKYSKKVLTDITAGLVIVESDEKAVRLVHLTAEDYFSDSETRKRLFPDASASITQTLLVYLCRKELSKPCQSDDEYEEFESRKRKHALLSYAYQNWGDHARQAGSDLATQSAILKFMSDPKRIESVIQASFYLEPTGSANWDVRKGANSLHLCAWFDLADIIPGLVREGLDVNSQDPTYRQTALMYACRRGNLSSVTTLLNLGAAVNLFSAKRSTAMFEAVLEDHVDVVRVLLTKKELLVNACHSGKCERTALMLASQEGYDEIVKALLERLDLKINQSDSYKQTALILATFSNRVPVIRSLLRHSDIDINAVNQSGNSALILAAKNGREDIVDLLLSKGADLSIKDQEGGGNALSWAVKGGDLSMVKTMLNHNADIQSLDEMGRSLLHVSAVNGKIDIIGLLIDKGLDKNSPDRKKRTPLHDASRYNMVEVTKILLRMGADSSLEDEAKRTPWTVAWEYGNVLVMRILEGREETIDQTLKDPYPIEDKLPIWSLAKLGRKDLVIDMIAKKSNLSMVSPDNGDSALHCAISSNQPEILEILLKSGLSPDSQNDYSRTPLHLAAICGDKISTSLLISNKASCSIPDKWSFVPLYYAQLSHHFEVALALIEAGANTKSLSTQAIQALFLAAVEYNRSKALKILIDKGADVLTKGVAGQTAFEIAMKKGDVEIQQLLKANKSRYYTKTMLEDLEKEEWGKEKVITAFPQPKDIEGDDIDKAADDLEERNTKETRKSSEAIENEKKVKNNDDEENEADEEEEIKLVKSLEKTAILA